MLRCRGKGRTQSPSKTDIAAPLQAGVETRPLKLEDYSRAPKVTAAALVPLHQAYRAGGNGPLHFPALSFCCTVHSIVIPRVQSPTDYAIR